MTFQPALSFIHPAIFRNALPSILLLIHGQARRWRLDDEENNSSSRCDLDDGLVGGCSAGGKYELWFTFDAGINHQCADEWIQPQTASDKQSAAVRVHQH